MILTRDQILAANANGPKSEKVTLPELGDVYVREMTGTQRDYWEIDSLNAKNEDGSLQRRNIRAKAVVMCACDEAGELLFTEADIEEVGLLGSTITEPIFDKVLKLSKLSEADIEELEKN